MAKKGSGKGKKGKKDGKSSGENRKVSDKLKYTLDKKIQEAFSIFDISGNNTCQTNEIGTVLRYLNLFPSEEKLKEWIKQMEEDEPTGYILYEKFYNVVFPVLVDDVPMLFDCIPVPLPPLPKKPYINGDVQEGEPAPTEEQVEAPAPIEPKRSFYFRGFDENMLTLAFKMLDKEGNGFLTSQQMSALLTNEGDRLLKEEMDDMLLATTDEHEQKVYIDQYINLIAHTTQSIN